MSFSIKTLLQTYSLDRKDPFALGCLLLECSAKFRMKNIARVVSLGRYRHALPSFCVSVVILAIRGHNNSLRYLSAVEIWIDHLYNSPVFVVATLSQCILPIEMST